MSDTIRNEEKYIWRERLTSEVSCFNADLSAFTLRLLEALGSAEANAKDNSEALTAAYMSGKYDGRKEAEANVTRLTKERDWLAELVFDRPCAYACCPLDKNRPTGPDDDCDKTHIQCWSEAARRAVAAGDG